MAILTSDDPQRKSPVQASVKLRLVALASGNTQLNGTDQGPTPWSTPIFVLAAVYFIIDGVFSYATRPITVWLSKKKLLERVRRWLRPWVRIPRSPSLRCQLSY